MLLSKQTRHLINKQFLPAFTIGFISYVIYPTLSNFSGILVKKVVLESKGVFEMINKQPNDQDVRTVKQ